MQGLSTVRRIVVGVACLVTSHAVHAQQVEIIGLKRWTVQNVKDSLVKYVPGSDTTLTTRSCGAELRELGFPRTASIIYPTRNVVSVVEPQDSAAAATNPEIRTIQPLPAAWQAALDPLVNSAGQFKNGVFDVGLKLYPLILAGKRDSLGAMMKAQGGDMPPQFDSLWAFFKAHASQQDLTQALDILHTDSLYAHRALAMAVLSNFSSNDEAWWALMHSLRDPHPDRNNAGFVASEILMGWLRDSVARPIQWKSQIADLHALFAGANLWLLPTVMQVLTYTKVDPALAHALLANNATYVLGYARSADPDAASIGRQLLVQFGARDFGANAAQWEQWAKTL